MGIQILKSLMGPYLKASMAVLVLMNLVLFYFNPYIGIGAVVVNAGLLLYYRKLGIENVEILGDYAKTITTDMEETTRLFISNNPLPLCMINRAGDVLWFNQRFSEIYQDAEMFTSTIAELTGIRQTDLVGKEDGELEKCVMINHNGKVYRVLTSSMNEKGEGSIMLYWMDVTNQETLKNLYKEEKSCFAYIIVDNYDELIASAPDEKKGILAAQIERTLRQWAKNMNGSATKYRSYQYQVVFEQKYFERLEAEKFSILDEIRALETEADFPASLSIGIGVGGKTPAQLEEYALAALDLALGRGGDQAVVKKGARIDYYGGKLQTVEKRNKGKSRIMAHALRQLIDQSSRVVIMGHKRPDMDCFGAGLGVFRIAKNRGKETAIVINGFHESLAEIYEKAKATGNYKFVNSEEAMALVDKDTLLVVVDVHKPSLTECPSLLKMTDKIVVIDHHRKAEENIENATLTYMESYASSTSELITEILQYVGEKKEIDRLEAEALLAGIAVDTKNFSVKTGVRTFEAASWLRRTGADTASVRELFKTDFAFFQKKAEMISNAEVLRGCIALSSYNGEPVSDVQVLTSQAADELLDIKGIKASFVAAQNDDGKTTISGRSLGEINVQTVLEKLGGGGHLTTAGAQVSETPKETVALLKEIILEMDL